MADETCDVAILGGAFSGASLALLLRREQPELRVTVIERSEEFDRKVGEATTEVSGDFLHKRLALTQYLTHNHISKQGLRLWFSEPDCGFEDCAEVGANYQVKVPAFQLDRAKLDEHLLELAGEAGARIIRPAKLNSFELAPGATRLEVSTATGAQTIRARWLIDASGRAAVVSRKLGLHRRLDAHPTNAIWARFRGTTDWDGHELRTKFPQFGATTVTSRGAATNHLTGYGWWCWIIPLKGGDFSAGLVYDSRLFAPPTEGKIAGRLMAHLMAHPVGREIFANAEPIESDARAYSHLPYYSDAIAGDGWQLVGDAAGFLDPLYSPGLDFCSWTVRCALGRIAAESRGEPVDLTKLNTRFSRAYDTWFRALYLDKYLYMGDAELMSAAYWMDIASFYFGPVREITIDRQLDLDCLPFNGPVDGAAGKIMAFYNRRLATIARKRIGAGCYGRRNTGWRELGDGFTPGWKSVFPLMKGIRRWLGAELHALTLKPANGKADAPQPQTAPAVKATAVS